MSLTVFARRPEVTVFVGALGLACSGILFRLSRERYAPTRADAPSSAASASRTGTKRPTKIGVSRSV